MSSRAGSRSPVGGDDTIPMPPPDGPPPPPAKPVSTEMAEEQVQELAKGGTNVDTLVGRLVVDQGLATLTAEDREALLRFARDERTIGAGFRKRLQRARERMRAAWRLRHE